MSFFKKFLLLAPLVVLSGCFKRSIRVTGNSFVNKKSLPHGFVRNKSFAIVNEPAEHETDPQNDLQATELEQKIALMLVDGGYTVTPLESADYVLKFNYGAQSYTRTENVLKYIPGETVQTRGAVDESDGSYKDYREIKQSSGSYVYVPENYTYCTKHLSIQAYLVDEAMKMHKNTDTKKPSAVWQGTVWTEDPQELRSCLDYLLVQVFDLFGRDSQKTIMGRIAENDTTVARLRQRYFWLD